MNESCSPCWTVFGSHSYSHWFSSLFILHCADWKGERAKTEGKCHLQLGVLSRSRGPLQMCSWEKVHASGFSSPLFPLPSLATSDLGLLSPYAFKEVLLSSQEEAGQEVFFCRPFKDLLASSTSCICIELWIPELTHPRTDWLTKWPQDPRALSLKPKCFQK